MGQKDLTQKTLESYPDVFADCVNALLYEGQTLLQVKNLLPASTESTYPDSAGELHNQFQDISKFEMRDGAIKAQYSIENQSEPDRHMTLRKFGYEGARYRAQYHSKEIYPIIDMVLYWGKRRWSSPKRLKKLFGRQQKIIHVEAFLRTMRVLTNDYRFEEVLLQMTEDEKKEDFRMCELLDKYWNGGVAEGKAEESIHNVRSMYSHKLSAETIAELINQSLEYINQIISLFTQYPEEDDLSIAKRLLAE